MRGRKGVRKEKERNGKGRTRGKERKKQEKEEGNKQNRKKNKERCGRREDMGGLRKGKGEIHVHIQFTCYYLTTKEIKLVTPINFQLSLVNESTST